MTNLLSLNTLTMGSGTYRLTGRAQEDGKYTFRALVEKDELDRFKFELNLAPDSSAGKYLGDYKITYLNEPNPILKEVKGKVRAFFEAEKMRYTLHPEGFAKSTTWFLTQEPAK